MRSWASALGRAQRDGAPAPHGLWGTHRGRHRRYARFQANPEAWRNAHPLVTLTVEDVETITVAIANEIDQCANGETVIARKAALASAEWDTYFDAVACSLGVPAFNDTLRTLLRAEQPQGLKLRLPHKESFRLGKGGIAPMAHGAFRAWDERAQAVAAAPAKEGARIRDPLKYASGG